MDKDLYNKLLFIAYFVALLGINIIMVDDALRLTIGVHANVNGRAYFIVQLITFMQLCTSSVAEFGSDRLIIMIK